VNLSDFMVHLLEDSRKHTLGLVEDLSDEEMMFQPQPDTNHALWLLGHIVTSENGLILTWCGGQPAMPEEYVQLFSIGTKPQSDPAPYPSKEEVLEVLADVHAKAIELVKGLSAEQLDERPVGYDEMPPGAQQLFWSKGACIWLHATHEASHAGAITLLRRLLGKPCRV